MARIKVRQCAFLVALLAASILRDFNRAEDGWSWYNKVVETLQTVA